jgi:hypothetical protein
MPKYQASTAPWPPTIPSLQRLASCWRFIVAIRRGSYGHGQAARHLLLPASRWAFMVGRGNKTTRSPLGPSSAGSDAAISCPAFHGVFSAPPMSAPGPSDSAERWLDLRLFFPVLLSRLNCYCTEKDWLILACPRSVCPIVSANYTNNNNSRVFIKTSQNMQELAIAEYYQTHALEIAPINGPVTLVSNLKLAVPVRWSSPER